MLLDDLSTSVKCIFISSAHFLNRFVFLLLSFKSSLSDGWFANISSLFLDCLCLLLTGSSTSKSF